MPDAMAEMIRCPECGHAFPLTEAVASALRDEVRGELAAQTKEAHAKLAHQQEALRLREASMAEKEAGLDQQVNQGIAKERERLLKDARKSAESEAADKIEALRSELDGKSEKLAAFSKREAVLERKTRELNESKAALQGEFETRLTQQTKQAEGRARQASDAAWEAKLQEMQKELEASEGQRVILKKQETALLKKERELKERAESVDLTIEQKLKEERDAMQAALRKGVQGEFELKLAEREKVIRDMGDTIKELQQKQEQGSQQLQGEVQELVLEDLLRAMFPTDTIEPVPKGVDGADCLHRVIARDGRVAGTIVWESKRTKRWNAQWVSKLKADQMRVEGHLAVILSSVLPPEISNFGEVDGVWVTNLDSVRGLAVALRRVLLEACAARMSQEGKESKMEQMYTYLTGGVFAQRVQAMMSAFAKMKDDLTKERSAIQRMWAKREKQIESLMDGTAGLHGDISGIVGQDMPAVPELEFEAQ